MKTLLLSNDDIQNFSKLIYDPKTAQQLATDAGQAASCNLMALQYYLKHPSNYPIAAPTTQIHHITNTNSGNNNNSNISNNHYSHNQPTHHHHSQSALLANLHHHHQQQTQATQQHQQQQTSQHQQPPPPPSQQQQSQQQHQQQQQQHHHRQQQQQHQHQQQQQHLLAQSQSQLKQLQLKQPTIHQHHANSTYLQHHPYYQQPAPISIPTPTSAVPVTTPAAPATRTIIAPAPVPVHALNQNSNFSAASSSTGGTGTGTTTTTATGTTTSSKNAPTQQSNTTVGSSLSPATATATRTSKSSSSSSTGGSNSVYGKVGGGGGSGSGSGGHSSGSSSNVRTSIVSGTKRLKTEPILSQFHQTERYTFANTHLVWSEENWRRVVFQDERKFNLDGPDGFTYYFHDLRNYERTLSQRPRGNSVYIYFIITAAGPIHLEVSTSKLRPETCIETILRERSNIVEKLGGIGSGGNGGDFVLQDHNWSVNALPSAQNWLSVEGIKTQKWPTIAHDLNIIENIWGWLIREVYDGGRKFSRKDDLIFRIREAWSRLPIDLVQNLYSTLPERITELYYTRGVYTNC